MCLSVYVATDAPLAPPFAPEAPGLCVRAVPAAQAAGITALSKRYVTAVGFDYTCGCEIHHPNRRARRELVWLLEWALRTVPEAELFVCDEGREHEESTRRDWTTAAELLAWRVLEGGTHLVVVRDPEGT